MLTRKELYVMKEDSVDGFMDFAVGTAKKAGAKALAYYGKGDTAVKFDDSLDSVFSVHPQRDHGYLVPLL